MSSTLTIIAGQGAFPKDLARTIAADGRPIAVAALTGFCEPDWINDYPHDWFSMGEAERLLAFLAANNSQQIAFAGAVKRPNLLRLKADKTAAAAIAKIAMRALGDDGLLKAVENELAAKGITVVGVNDLAKPLLAPNGGLTQRIPTDVELVLVSAGISAAKTIGALDIGQSVVVAEGRVVAVEGSDGTDALIARGASHHSPILVKMCKPQQSQTFDLPSFGAGTVRALVKGGYAGAVIEGGKTLFLERKTALELADAKGLFVYAM